MKTTMTMTGKQLKEKYDFKFMYEVSGEIDNRLALLVLGGRFNADNVDTLFDQTLKESYDAILAKKLAEFFYLVDVSSFPSFDEFMEKNSIELNKIHDDIKDFLKTA